jgi:hypothetical protein
MPDDHTVTGSAEAHKIIIIMCAVGSTPAQLDNTSGTGKSRSTQSNVGKQGERGEAKISSRQTRLNAVDES